MPLGSRFSSFFVSLPESLSFACAVSFKMSLEVVYLSEHCTENSRDNHNAKRQHSRLRVTL